MSASTPASFLDELPALWNTSADNPATHERQARSEELTAFQTKHDPDYARELAQLRSRIANH